MAWGRIGDTSNTYPRLLAACSMPDAPPGALPMVFGFLCLLATMSGGHNTDYIVNAGHLRAAADGQQEWLLKVCLKTGLLTRRREKEHGAQTWKLIDDPKFIHLRLKEEIEWEDQQRSDTLNVRISVPVRMRDGDLCRYCGVIVHWKGPAGAQRRKGTLDHLTPKLPDGSRPAATIDTMVVACLSCNSEEKDKLGADRSPLLPQPDVPFYGKTTARWLTEKGQPTRPTIESYDDSDPDPGPRAAARQRPATADPAHAAVSDPDSGPRAPQHLDHAAHGPPAVLPEKPVPRTTPEVEERDSAGTGRDGTGSALLLASATPPGSTSAPRSRRSHRGRDQ